MMFSSCSNLSRTAGVTLPYLAAAPSIVRRRSNAADDSPDGGEYFGNSFRPRSRPGSHRSAMTSVFSMAPGKWASIWRISAADLR
ncbi:MAG: hypothetical protein BWY85_01884 [Firmicutes bacterium ADurb.Bin506]|nr:MAG: hypothetical protein BWY85_01884 [Firmicutes bacterium ADurb.Bin506]